MKNKKFVRIFLISIAIFILFHILVWEVGNNKKLLAPKKGYMVGDLARISYCPSCAVTRKRSIKTLPKKAYLTKQNKKGIEILTFGDSFSGGAGGGINSAYQDYIATYSGLRVMNIPCYHRPVETLIKYINSKEIDELKPKYIILESVERVTIQRLIKDLKIAPNNSNNKPETKKNHHKKTKTPPRTNFINTGNYKFVLYNFLYNFNQRAFIATAHRMTTKKKFLGHKFILVHGTDIDYLNIVTPENIKKINKNLNKINDALAQKGIKFYFMICPDKYDLYYDFMSKPYGKNYLFDMLRKEKKNYNFIDAKAILKKEIDKGVLDVYHFDDTHWTHKASEAIFKKIRFE